MQEEPVALETDPIIKPASPVQPYLEEDKDDANSLEEEDFDDDDRPAERWAPLGAACSPEPGAGPSDERHEGNNEQTVKILEEEQEHLNNSLLALTSHFAQVQFRLKQIIAAPTDSKDDLLKELEEFAFRGIPDVRGVTEAGETCNEDSEDEEQKLRMQKHRAKQLQLIEQLKTQLEDLETFAYETGERKAPPTSRVMEKQRVVIDELRNSLGLELDNLAGLSADELRSVVDQAVSSIVHPAKVKEKLVDQLKTQIVDLERFIDFLQGEVSDMPLSSLSSELASTLKTSAKVSSCPLHSTQIPTTYLPICRAVIAKSYWPSFLCPMIKLCSRQKSKNTGAASSKADCNCPKKRGKVASEDGDNQELRDATVTVMRRAITMLQLYAVSHLGCTGGTDFQTNVLKRTDKANHWGDLRAALEMAVERVSAAARLAQELTREREAVAALSSRAGRGGVLLEDAEGERPQPADGDYSQTDGESDKDDEDDEPEEVFEEEYHSDSERYLVSKEQQHLTHLVRRELVPALRDLIQHGLMETGQARGLIPFGCLPTRSAHREPMRMMHAWDLFLRFYEMKNGREYNESPARKLSESFDLHIVGGKAITTKQQLLSAIDKVITSHTSFKRSEDSQLKALVCLALNERKLVPWLKLVLKNPTLQDHFYQPWSYTMKTGFDDSFHSLKKLEKLEFKLPFDLAVRQLKNIRDAF